MVDLTNQEQIKVSTDSDLQFPYIMVSVEQLPTVESILENHKVTYWVDRESISINGGPHITVVNLRRGTDPVRIQELLDAA